MNTAEYRTWLKYWKKANQINVDHIKSYKRTLAAFPQQSAARSKLQSQLSAVRASARMLYELRDRVKEEHWNANPTAFNKIKAGLEDALAHAQGDETAAVIHKVDAAELANKGIPPKQF